MTPADLARLHAAWFTTPRPWSETEFASLLDGQGAFLVTDPQGFALGRALAGEAELLTIAVAPEARRQGVGSRILRRFLDMAEDKGAATVYLEVAADNLAAITLYRGAGFAEAGRRKAYYRMPDGERIDALVLRHPATDNAPEV